MIIYVDSFIDSMEEFLELMSEFSRVAGYKIKMEIQSYVFILGTKNWKLNFFNAF